MKDLEHKVEDAVVKVEQAVEHAAEVAIEKVVEVEQKAVEKLREAATHFFKLEAAGGILLVLAAAAALIVANSPWAGYYNTILNDIVFRIGLAPADGGFGEALGFQKTILHWINDGMMAIFFFLVGLEIKREIMEGELSSRERALLPALAAIGGMAVPALIYFMINRDDPAMVSGWAIPAATDIAFALGILALLGSRAPFSLKVLLTAIAIIDDLGAIIIIAVFYGHGFSPEPLMIAAGALVVLTILNRKRVTSLTPYILVGFIMWAAVLESGVHATLAGVLTALFIPVRDHKNPDYSPLRHLEHSLHPWVAFGVLPIFAFANAGVPLGGLGWELLFHPVTLGIMAGLFIGKQLGIFLVLWLTIKSGLSPKPENVNWVQLYGVSVLCGIGFTMSLFIGGLAFAGPEMQAYVRVGVLAGSVLSAVVGYSLLRFGPVHYAPASDKGKDVPLQMPGH
ncbi:MAG: Na+/H+ antiporter NhaA [Alphaproteobacteria bacterium]|nr:Na+/H+ antiporter NhaA [Alphaproteobacteria bacterium]